MRRITDTLPDDVRTLIYTAAAVDGAEDTAERSTILSILSNEGFTAMEMGEATVMIASGVDMPENSLHELVEQELVANGIDVELDGVSDTKVAQLYAYISNIDGEPDAATVESYLAN